MSHAPFRSKSKPLLATMKTPVRRLLLPVFNMSPADAKPGFPPAFRRKLKRMNAAVYTVFTKNHRDYDNQFKTLAAVLGSEKAAKKSFFTSHGPITSSFSAILTPDQSDQVSKHPDVFDVVQDHGKKVVY